MGWHMGATFGLIGTAIVTLLEAKRDGLHGVVRSWTGWDWNYPDSWFPQTIRAPIPMAVGGVVTFVAIKTHYNDWTPTGANL